MKISDRQVLELISLAQSFSAALHQFHQPEDAKYVRTLLDEIISQQSDELVERSDD